MKCMIVKGRRQFLLGAGGASLALPLLPSWLSLSDAEAAEAGPGKCFAYMQLPHGGVVQQDMYPEAAAAESKTYAGHSIRRQTLQGKVANGETRISAVLRAPSSRLTPALIAKMNVLRGVDLPHYPGHGGGQALGNFSDITGGLIDEEINWRKPTIDQVMSYAPGFYAATPAERAIVFGPLSFQYENQAAQSGALRQTKEFGGSNLALFDKLFGSQPLPNSKPTAAPDTRLIDKVFENFKRVRDSGRLSNVDKRVLDDHAQRIAELQNKLKRPLVGANIARPSSDTAKVIGTDDYGINPKLHIEHWRLWLDVVAAAFSVGASRVFVAFLDQTTFSDHSGDWHDLAHSSEQARRVKFTESNQKFFQDVMLDFAAKLDATTTGNGKSVLDSSLVAWAHESGSYSHHGTAMPIVTFGSANGYMATGQYCDYRNLDKKIVVPGSEDRHHGLVWHQWLGTALQAMGIPQSAYPGLKGGMGYPTNRTGELSNSAEETTRYQGSGPAYPDAVWQAAVNEPLPWLKA